MQRVTCRTILAAAPAAVALAAWPARAAQQYDPGASDTEIKIGNIMPYSGPASAYGVIGKTEARFFAMINDEAGSTGARSPFSPTMTATARPRRWSRRAAWSRATRCC